MLAALPAALLIFAQLPLAIDQPAATRAEERPNFLQVTAGRPRVVHSSNPLIDALLLEFRKRNPAIARGGISDLRQASPDRYIAVGWGSTEDQVFRGRFEDWLLGVFVVDATLARVERVLEIMPTPRWGDYTISIQTLTPYRVTLRGEGGYGDGVLRRVFDIGDAPSPELLEASRKVVRLPASRFRQLPAAVRQQLEADGCVVPQSPKESRPHNVVSGQFAASGQLDWAILCSIEGQPSIRIYWGGYAACRAPVVEWVAPDWAFLDYPDLRWDLVIQPMSSREAINSAEKTGVKLTEPVHQGIFERYCQNGTWLDLHVIP